MSYRTCKPRLWCFVESFFRVLALAKKYKGRASTKSLKLSSYNNPHELSPPLPLTQLRVWLIPMTEAELAPRCCWEREVLTFCSCHPLTTAGFDSHLIPHWADWNNKRAGKHSGGFFSPGQWVKPSYPEIRSKQAGQGVLAGKASEISLSAAARPGPGWLCCELTLDHSCRAASPGCFITKGTSLHLLRPYSHLFSCSVADFPFFLS